MRGSYINFAKKFQTNRQPPSSASPSGRLCRAAAVERSPSASPFGLFLPSCRQRQSLRLSCPQSGLKRSIVPYSRLPLGGKLSTKLTDEGAATLTLLKNFKQTDSRPPWLPLWGSCPQSGLKRTPPPFSPIFQERNKNFKKIPFPRHTSARRNLRKNFLCVIIFSAEHPGTANAISALRSRKNIVP